MFPLESIQLPVVKADDLDDIPAAGVKMARPDGDHKAVVTARPMEAGRPGLPGDDQVPGRADRASGGGGRQVGAEREPGDRAVVRPRLAPGREAALAEVRLVGGSRAGALAFIAPGVTKPNTRCDAAVDFMSIYPTLVDLIGLPIPEHVQGPSLRPLLDEPASGLGPGGPHHAWPRQPRRPRPRAGVTSAMPMAPRNCTTTATTLTNGRTWPASRSTRRSNAGWPPDSRRRSRRCAVGTSERGQAESEQACQDPAGRRSSGGGLSDFLRSRVADLGSFNP